MQILLPPTVVDLEDPRATHILALLALRGQRRDPPLDQRSLAERAGLSYATLRRVMKKLTATGLVRVTRRGRGQAAVISLPWFERSAHPNEQPGEPPEAAPLRNELAALKHEVAAIGLRMAKLETSRSPVADPALPAPLSPDAIVDHVRATGAEGVSVRGLCGRLGMAYDNRSRKAIQRALKKLIKAEAITRVGSQRRARYVATTPCRLVA